jgi:hypothetical protein
MFDDYCCADHCSCACRTNRPCSLSTLVSRRICKAVVGHTLFLNFDQTIVSLHDFSTILAKLLVLKKSVGPMLDRTLFGEKAFQFILTLNIQSRYLPAIYKWIAYSAYHDFYLILLHRTIFEYPFLFASPAFRNLFVDPTQILSTEPRSLKVLASEEACVAVLSHTLVTTLPESPVSLVTFTKFLRVVKVSESSIMNAWIHSQSKILCKNNTLSLPIPNALKQTVLDCSDSIACRHFANMVLYKTVFDFPHLCLSDINYFLVCSPQLLINW